MATSHHRPPHSVPARLGLVASLIAGGVLLGPAAEAGSSAVCVARFPISLTPGLGTSASTFRYSSNGQAGTVSCSGSIDGSAVTGPGTIWDEGVGSGSCNGGTVQGFHEYKIPTEAGIATIRRPVLGTYSGVVGIRDSRRSYAGGFVFYPTEGDCITAPASRAEAVAYGIVLD